MNYSVDQDPNRTLTLVLYVLYIIAIFSGGLLAIIALIINYVKRVMYKARFLKVILLGKFVPFGGISLGILLPLFHFSFCSLLEIIRMPLRVLHYQEPFSVLRSSLLHGFGLFIVRFVV
jgi:hypothetical protein